MARLRDRRPHRDDQCPERGAGLSHAQDGTPECVFCHQQTSSYDVGVVREAEATDATPVESSLERIPADEVELSRIVFTQRELAHLYFVRWLHDQGWI